LVCGRLPAVLVMLQLLQQFLLLLQRISLCLYTTMHQTLLINNALSCLS
jgi:hypothetical protein